jgi:hypothetical protein
VKAGELDKGSTVETLAIIWVLAAWFTLCVTYEAVSRSIDAIAGKK